MRQRCFRMALTWPLPVLTEILRSVETIDHRETLPAIRTPVLVVHGRHDRKNRYEGGAYLAEHVPGAQLVVFEESAHCPMLEEVERFTEVIAAFCAGD